MIDNCPVCDEEFEDEGKFQEHLKSAHEKKSILNKPDFSHKVRGGKMKFTKRMRDIIKNMGESEITLADEVLYRVVNGKKKRSGHQKWYTLKQKHPRIAKTVWELYEKKFADDLGFVTIDNFSDTDTLLELAAKQEPKKKKKKAGKMAKILERLDELEKRVGKLEK